MTITLFQEVGGLELYAEVVCGEEEAHPPFYMWYDTTTRVSDVLEEGARVLDLDIEDFDMHIEYPVGFPGIDLSYQADELDYVKLPVCDYAANFVFAVRQAQIVAMKHPDNETIAKELCKQENINLFRIYISTLAG